MHTELYWKIRTQEITWVSSVKTTLRLETLHFAQTVYSWVYISRYKQRLFP